MIFDFAIVGCDTMGSMLAERLSADGHSGLLLDRRPPAMGSTAASTAQLMWAIDVPLCRLADDLGEAEAGRRAALVSDGGFEVDPVRLAHGLLREPKATVPSPLSTGCHGAQRRP
jgi:glycine/D-amino acid oxidase-like deaminating enzyme